MPTFYSSLFSGDATYRHFQESLYTPYVKNDLRNQKDTQIFYIKFWKFVEFKSTQKSRDLKKICRHPQKKIEKRRYVAAHGIFVVFV